MTLLTPERQVETYSLGKSSPIAAIVSSSCGKGHGCFSQAQRRLVWQKQSEQGKCGLRYGWRGRQEPGHMGPDGPQRGV